MDEKIENLLRNWAEKFHTKDFVKNDPISFPSRYFSRNDIEISGFFTAFLSFGNRAQILKTAEKLDEIFGRKPFKYLRSRAWERDFKRGDSASFYRMISHEKMREMFERIFEIYERFGNVENAILSARERRNSPALPFENFCEILGVSAKFPQKKLNMFLRWMIRKNSPVDFGIWKKFSPAELLIPLDTHVLRVSRSLGLTNSKSFSLSAAKEITANLAKIFPGDPCLGDFALFGAGVSGEI